MYGTDMLLGAGLGGLLIGGILAFFWGRSSSDGSQQAREMERKLEQVTKEKKAYEQRVTEHFMETANRLNSLTANYRSIHEHLADGARALCGETVEVKMDRLAGSSAEVADNLLEVEPPRDYAPKVSPTAPGMLNESFGIEREDVPPAEHRDTEDAEDVVTDTESQQQADTQAEAAAEDENAELRATDAATSAADAEEEKAAPAAEQSDDTADPDTDKEAGAERAEADADEQSAGEDKEHAEVGTAKDDTEEEDLDKTQIGATQR